MKKNNQNQNSAHRKISLVFITRLTAGGIKSHLYDLISNLDKNKYQIALLGPIDDEFKKSLAKIEVPTFFVDIADKIKPLQDALSIFKLSKYLKALKPDILHIHGNKSALVGRIAAKRAKVKNVIVTVHNFLTYQKKPGLKAKIAFFEERRLSKRTSKIIAVSEQIKKSLIEKEGLPNDKIQVIHNGIDISKFNKMSSNLRKDLKIKQSNFLILNIGRMIEFKGQKYLIKACSLLAQEMTDFKIIIAGEGPLEDDLKELAKKLNLDNKIIFLPKVKDINAVYGIADCFILPSINEPFGLVLLEAMAHRVPIIASKSGGVIDILNNETAILVKPKSAFEIAKAIKKLAQDKPLSEQLAEKAYERLKQKFTLEKMVKKTENLYKMVLGTSNHNPSSF